MNSQHAGKKANCLILFFFNLMHFNSNINEVIIINANPLSLQQMATQLFEGMTLPCTWVYNLFLLSSFLFYFQNSIKTHKSKWRENNTVQQASIKQIHQETNEKKINTHSEETSQAFSGGFKEDNERDDIILISPKR